MEHVFPVTVYFSDTDCGGVVYHPHYLDFAEHARSEMVNEYFSLNDLLKEKFSFVVRKLEVSYDHPGKLGDHLTVRTTVFSMKRFSMTVHQRIMREELLLADLIVRLACIDPDTGKIQSIPSAVQESLSGYMEKSSPNE
ncbi:MAG: YbgC/FadM family acyl-CoA thioesterase [Spirochaetia bacterium]|jgi:tol-pal system-associated acyl-CoA thioesterase|nr:YbgC/FadM family acyl-CoA thioesterase [Spirochaetia bacterium]